jgi:hypothetical protein
MPLSENCNLEEGCQSSIATQRVALPLNVSAKDKLFNESCAERQHQECQSLNTAFRNHRLKYRTIMLERSEDAVGQISDYSHPGKSGDGNAQVAGNSAPTVPFSPDELAPSNLAAPSNANESYAEDQPQESSQDKAKLQECPRMLGALRTDVGDGQSTGPAQNQGENKKHREQRNKIGGAGYSVSQSPVKTHLDESFQSALD